MILNPMELGALEWVRDGGGLGYYSTARRICEAKGWISEGALTETGEEALRVHKATRRVENLRRNVIPTISPDARRALADLVEGRQITWNEMRELIGHACAYYRPGHIVVTPLGRELLKLF